MAKVTFRILGRLEVRVDGRRVDLASRRERALLGVLLLHVGDVVSADALIDSVWGEQAPVSARHMVHEYVSRLRVALGDASVIATRPPGYVVEGDACELDAARFEALLALARSAVAAHGFDEALATFDEALGLWQGDALSDVALEGDGRAAAMRLDDQRRAARSERVDVALRLGRHHELIPDLERAVAADPLDEHLLGQLMLALYRDGRQADALARYRDGRQRLVGELGIEPGAELRSLEQSILRHDAELASPTRAVPIPAPSGRWRVRAGLAATAVAVGAIAAGAATLGRGPATGAPVHGDAVAIVDASTARLLGSVPLDSRPAAIAYGAGSIWVASPDARSVARISPADRSVVASVTLDHPAQDLAASGGTVWAVGSSLADPYLTLERIDPTFNDATRVRRLPMVILGDSGSLTADRGTVLVAPRSGFLTQIDVRSGRVLHRLDPHAAPTAVAYGFGSTWLAYREANIVARVDAAGAITTIPVGRSPSAITVGRGAVWVADALDNTVKSIDPAGAVITTVTVGATPAAIAEGEGSVWVANAGDGTLTRIDERTSRPSAPVAVGGSPQALVVADGKVWVSVQPPPRAKPAGGTIVVSVPSFVSVFDPAVEETIDAGAIDYAICSTLLNNPDEPGPAGLQLVPDAAREMPTVSDGGRVYTFRIRPGRRFSPPSNELVTAATFKHTIERSLSPAIAKVWAGGVPPGAQELPDVVGAAAYIAGKARHVSGISVHGDRLTIRLTHPAPDLPARLSTPPFCAVPSDMPRTPVSGAFPSAGPYYIADATPNRSIVLLRNPNYHGDRVRRPRRIEVLIGVPHPVAAVESAKVDYAIDGVRADQSARLERLYGPQSPAARKGRQRYFVNRMLEVDSIHLNTSRPLFADAWMRRAASYAVDRRALAADGGTFYAHANVAEMFLPPGVPGFRDEHVYPLTPDVAKARRLAGHGQHTAVLYCLLQGGSPRAAQIIANNLAAIGIDVRVHCMPGDEFYSRILHPNDPWDMAVDGWAGLDDPSDFLNGFARRDAFNVSHLNDPRIDALVHAAARRSGLARAFAYARVDHAIVADAVPEIAFANESAHDFFSARIGCQLFQPASGMDLGSLCIRTTHAANP